MQLKPLTNTGLWRARVAYVILSVALWVAAWPVRDTEWALGLVLGAAVIANITLVYVAFYVPSVDTFREGEDIGKGIGYQRGFGDGSQQGEKIGKGIGYAAGFRDGVRRTEGLTIKAAETVRTAAETVHAVAEEAAQGVTDGVRAADAREHQTRLHLAAHGGYAHG